MGLCNLLLTSCPGAKTRSWRRSTLDGLRKRSLRWCPSKVSAATDSVSPGSSRKRTRSRRSCPSRSWAAALPLNPGSSFPLTLYYLSPLSHGMCDYYLFGHATHNTLLNCSELVHGCRDSDHPSVSVTIINCAIQISYSSQCAWVERCPLVIYTERVTHPRPQHMELKMYGSLCVFQTADRVTWLNSQLFGNLICDDLLKCQGVGIIAIKR